MLLFSLLFGTQSVVAPSRDVAENVVTQTETAQFVSQIEMVDVSVFAIGEIEEVYLSATREGELLSEHSKNAFQLIRLSNGEKISFVYLFPVNSHLFENVDLISFEGFKYYLKNTVALLSDSYKDKAEGIDGAEVTDPTYYSDYDAVGFALNFSNAESFNAYFDVNGGSETEFEESGVFVKKYSYTTSFPFSTTSADALIRLMKNTVIMWGETFGMDNSTIVSIYDHSTYIYEMISTAKTVRSENFYESGGLYYNTFERTYADLETAEPLNLYYLEINRGVWYLTVLVVFVVVFVGVLLYYKFSTRKKLSKHKN